MIGKQLSLFVHYDILKFSVYNIYFFVWGSMFPKQRIPSLHCGEDHARRGECVYHRTLPRCDLKACSRPCLSVTTEPTGAGAHLMLKWARLRSPCAAPARAARLCPCISVVRRRGLFIQKSLICIGAGARVALHLFPWMALSSMWGWGGDLIPGSNATALTWLLNAWVHWRGGPASPPPPPPGCNLPAGA